MQRASRRDFFPEIDISRQETTLHDGRPAIIEVWLDRDTRATCQSVFYSRIDAENWSNDDHQAYLSKNNILKGNVAEITVVATVDAAKREMWCVTEILSFSDE